ncbi:hypothetical protein ACFX13_019105 [Malus domestica]|uniref:ARM repeat N-terminal plant domain-containing protein n=1 Tax=Malus domestica TaxID=3750 RepID=A0A498HVD1_MALDO|nr:hypothetical protein DVH24_030127 [Malus domestica]
MNSQSQNTTTKTCDPECTKPSCFFCSMKEPDPSNQKVKIIRALLDLPFSHDQEHVLVLSSLWNIAMENPNDPEFPSLGIFECMAKLIHKGLNDKEWLLTDQNIYIPYYAAHIIGSYAMNIVEFAEEAVKSGVVLPLLELMRGEITWVEQRVAVRALVHIAGHDKVFEEAFSANEFEIVELAMEIALTGPKEVYDKFAELERTERLKYHCNLVTSGVDGGLEIENRKAEEWASQLQCWSLSLLHSFARREKSLNLICKKEFLVKLCVMWGGLENQTSPAGIGLLRTLCQTKFGRQSVANSEEVVGELCNLSRSSDDWQIMAIDSLLLLLKDPETRYKVMEKSVVFLVDLVELRSCGGRPKVGDTIAQTLLIDYHKIKYGNLKVESKNAEIALEEIWDLKVDRKRRERLMFEQEVRKKKSMVKELKQRGNESFQSGNLEKAVLEYSEAMDLCPLKIRNERIVLHSNRAQCFLLLKKPDAVISDTTRALCLSSSMSPHGKSLWRRSQAYDMKGLAKESLIDCLAFVNERLKSKEPKTEKIPSYAAHMYIKQMNRTWLFAPATSRTFNMHEDLLELHERCRPTIVEETFDEKRWRKVERERRKKDINLSERVGRLKIG